MSEPVDASMDTTDIENVVVQIWQSLLGLDGIGPDDNFFLLGGRSLTAMRVVTQVRDQIGVPVKLADIFRAPELRSFAELLGKRIAEHEQVVPRDSK
ncbi:phosphopantetheine-binding protein [Streptomyces sp. NBC_00258]|uniref:phosphopantetheine-binding protein n=1 Tax=Streptomyces sp. NBC_00258 TaxID=2903642 RepID=UPI002E294A6C|nr:phosphopantetheine-binding protein [Streptomyces sp. NBC_00258]